MVVLVGANRSGTTVLAALLGSLPGAFNGGEIAHLWDRGIALNELCGCGEAFRECPVWSRITGPTHEDDVAFVREVQPGLDRLRMVPALLRGGFRTERERLGAILGRTYRRIQEVTGSRVIVDSYLVLYGMERLGLASQGGSLSDVEIDVGSQHTVSGNPVRFSTEPLRLREDLEYVEGMRFLDRAVVTALCWPWLRAYGYRWGGGVREGG